MADKNHELLIQHINNHFEDIKETLIELVAIPGVAWDSYDPADQQKMAEVTATLLQDAGLPNVEILSVTDGHVVGKPAVVASRPAKKGYPTVLLYAHHDVQPEGDEALWETKPYEAVEKNGRLYGRGAADDKAGLMVHVSAIKAMLDTYGSDMNLGIKVFIEGEEEAGSPTFRKFIDTYQEKLEADAIIVADSINWATGKPALTSTLRGVVGATMELEVLDHAVHSGMFGGPVVDALTCMAKIVASFHDENGEVAIKGLISSEETDIDMDEKTYRADSSVLDHIELAGSGSITSRLWTKPALSLIGFDAPAVEVASNTLIPKAKAKVSLRIAPGQDPYEAFDLLKKHVQEHAPFGTQVKFSDMEYGKPFSTDVEEKYAQAMIHSLESAWDTQAVIAGGAGSIPLATDLKDVFPHAEVLITGVEDPDSRAHSPNESLHLDDFKRAIIAETLFLAHCMEDSDGKN